MTGKQINQKIAKALGLPGTNPEDYCGDLNYIHAAVETLRTMPGPEWYDYSQHLMELCGSVANCIQAKARPRAEALLRTLERRTR